MSDINLLPDDLKKREQKVLQQKNSFSNSGIEFTNGKLTSKTNNNSKNLVTNPGLNNNPNLNRDIKIKNSYNFNSNSIPNNKDFKDETVLDLDNLDIAENKPKNQEIKEKNINIIQKSKIENKILVKDIKQEAPKNAPRVAKSQRKSQKDILTYLRGVLDNLFNKKNLEEDKSDVNLLPKELNIVSSANIVTMILYTLLISIIILFVVYFGVVIYKISIDKKINIIDLQIESIVNNPEEFDKLISKIEDLKRRNEKIKSLLSKHIYWTEFFAQLERHTLPEVKFTSFTGSTNGNITLASTAPDYYTVARQWLELKNNAKSFVDDVLVDGASASGSQSSGIDTKINFSLTLDLNDKVFYKSQ